MTNKLDLDRLRNLGIIAHVDSGKTTFTERVLAITGIIKNIGEVHEGEATMDFLEAERKRGITIQSAATRCEWTYKNKKYNINIIDTPGHIDFSVEVERSLRVLDGAICVLEGVEGVQPQTYTVWSQANRYNVPIVVFINKLDRLGADFFYAVSTIKDKLKVNPVLMQIPVYEENLVGMIDLINEKYYHWTEGIDYEIREIPVSYKEQVAKYRAELLDHIAGFGNENIFNEYLETQNIEDIETIYSLIKKGTLSGDIVPIFGGSAYKNIGVQNMLDGVIQILPSPLDRIDVSEKIYEKMYNENKTLSRIENKQLIEGSKNVAIVFKIIKDKYFGRLSFVRSYWGELTKGITLYNPRTKEIVRIGKIVLMHAGSHELVENISPGSIGAIMGKFDFTTGDTLCLKNSPVLLESIQKLEKVISMTLIPETKADQEKLGPALSDMASEDPSFEFKTDNLGEITISGMGELHLEIKIDFLASEYGIHVKPGKPKVNYLTRVLSEATTRYRHKKQTGGSGQFAEIEATLSPRSERYLKDTKESMGFINELRGECIPSPYVPYIEKGIKELSTHCGLKDTQVVDFNITVTDGAHHAVDSSALAFELASKSMFKELLNKVKTIILEPYMDISITTPEEYVGKVTQDLTKKGGEITDIFELKLGNRLIKGHIPLSSTFGYITDLRTITSGKATFSMSFYEYRPCNKPLESI